tara:strand:+ start:276 stop:524 length:249 start_codon:yes stop_codon:yes gene_type:complete
MDEYLIDVEFDGVAEQIKTYASSVFEAMDSMITLKGVEEVFSILRTRDNKSWTVEELNLTKLRELRELIGDDAGIIKELRKK